MKYSNLQSINLKFDIFYNIKKNVNSKVIFIFWIAHKEQKNFQGTIQLISIFKTNEACPIYLKTFCFAFSPLIN